MLEAAHALGQRLADRGRLAGVCDDIGVVFGRRPDRAADLAVGHLRVLVVLVRSGQAAVDEDLHVIGARRELGQRGGVELLLPGGVGAGRSLAVAARSRDGPARAEDARRGEPAAPHRGAQQQVGAVLLVHAPDGGDPGPQRLAGPGRGPVGGDGRVLRLVGRAEREHDRQVGVAGDQPGQQPAPGDVDDLPVGQPSRRRGGDLRHGPAGGLDGPAVMPLAGQHVDHAGVDEPGQGGPPDLMWQAISRPSPGPAAGRVRGSCPGRAGSADGTGSPPGDWPGRVRRRAGRPAVPCPDLRDRRHQRLGVGVPRVTPHHVGRADLDDPAQVHDRDPVRDLADHGQVVGNQDEPEVGVVDQFAEQVGDLRLGRGVQGADRLVGDQAGRLGHQRPGDGDPLPLAAAELVRITGRRGGRKPDAFQQLGSLPQAVGAAAAAEPDAVRDDLADLAARVEGLVRVLEDHLQPAQELRPAPPPQRGDGPALEGDGAGRQRLEADRGPGQRRLAAARLADQPDDLAARHGEVHPVDGAQALAAASVLHRDTGELEDGVTHGVALSGSGGQASRCCSATRSGSGLSVAHDGRAYLQRGWNGQPAGTCPSDGGLPPIGTSGAPLSCGSASSSPRVYGCRGRASSSEVGPASASRPAYITNSRRAVADITPRSCVMTMTAMPRSRHSRSSSRRMPACTVTSRAVVGSSATSSRGSAASATAIAMRWRMPPENCPGYERSACSGSGMRTVSSSPAARDERLFLAHLEVVPHVLGQLGADRQDRVQRGGRILGHHRDLATTDRPAAACRTGWSARCRPAGSSRSPAPRAAAARTATAR